MGIVLERSDASDLIRLEGAIDIASAAELKSVLLEALGAGRAVRLALEGVTHLDVTAMQLLWAAEREARSAGAVFALEGPAPAPIGAALNEAGFTNFLAPVNAE